MARGGIGLGGLLLLAGAAAGGYWYGQRADRLDDHAGQAPEEILADGQTVITSVRQLARLETVTFHMERIIDLKNRQSRFFGLLRADDAILLVAAGDVIAGVDLAEMGPADVALEPEVRTATLTLPTPRVLSAALDNERTYVYSRKTALLAGRNATLETRARQLAEAEIRRAALSAGILGHARRGADHSLRALVHSLGYRNVHIRFASQQQ